MSGPRTPLFRVPALALVTALLIPLGLAIGTAPAAAVEGECPPGFLPGPGNGNEIWTDDNVAVFAGGDFLADGSAAESEGLLVVMGDATFDKDAGGRFNVGWVGVGSGTAPSPGSVMLAVGGGLQVGGSTVLDVGSGARDENGDLVGGGVEVGGAAQPTFPATQYELNNGTLEVGMGADAVADWATFGASMATDSATWTAMPDTNPSIVAGVKLTLTGDGTSDLQVFTVTAAQLNAVSEVYFTNIADDASVVINVVGTEPVTFSPNYFAVDDVRADDMTSALFGRVSQRTMWNFADTTSATFGGSSQFLGSVLAPSADFDITASMNGRVYAGGDIHMHGVGNEFHNYPWEDGGDYDCIPAPDIDGLGAVTLTKVLESTGVVAADREFYGWIECHGDGIEGEYYKEGVIRAGDTLTLTDLPVGSVCRIFEDPERVRPLQGPLLPGFVWAEPVWTINGVVVEVPEFTVVDPDDPTQVAITLANTLLGRFSVTKVVDGPEGAYIGDRTFEISYTCDAEAFDEAGSPLGAGSNAGVFDVEAGQTATSPWYPVGTTCRVAEETPAVLPGDFAGDEQWQAPVIEPDTVTIGAGDVSPVTVRVTNTFSAAAERTGSFTIDKVVRNSEALPYEDAFRGGWTCTLGDQRLSGTWSVASTGAPVVVSGIPVGAGCAVSEDAPAAPTGGGTWSAPVITPATFTIADETTVVAVTVTNTLHGDLPVTGGSIPWWAIGLGGTLLVAGAAVTTVALARRRKR